MNYIADGVPAYHVVNTSRDRRYQIEKDIIADPIRNVILQRVKFSPLQGKLEDYHLYALISPHLGNQGYKNSGFVSDYKGLPMVFATYEGQTLAMACSTPWLQCSAGFVGTSDGWQDLSQHKQMTWHYDQAHEGNVALTAEVDLKQSNGEFVVAIAIDVRETAAGHLARASLLDGFDPALARYIEEWGNLQELLASLEASEPHTPNLYRVSTTVLHTHEGKEFLGGLIASLSIPWGATHGDENSGGITWCGRAIWLS